MSNVTLKQQVMLNLSMMRKCPVCGQQPTIRVENKKFSACHGCVDGTLITTRQHAIWARDEVAADWNAWVAKITELNRIPQ